MTNKKNIIIGILIVLVVAGFLINFYFLHRIDEDSKLSSVRALEHAIRHKLRHLHPDYINRNAKFFMYRNKLLRNYKPQPYEDPTVIWDIVNWWPNENDIYPTYDSSMGQLLLSLRDEPITKAQNSPKGTQLKLMFKLANQQKVIFKPQQYGRDDNIEGLVYTGKDRHNAEIYSFYLGAVLDFRWTPIVVGRKINLEEIYQVADSDLKKTMILNEGDNETTQYCFYGRCHFCSKEEPICGDENNIIEGAMIFLIPGSLQRHKSPWQRTYKETTRADWEDNMHYCKSLKGKLETTTLLDLIDASIFDYLIQNGDRHHYETREERLVLIDNGKGFGNSGKDFLDILAPLYQCCLIRKTTWDRLEVFSGGTLTDLIDRMTKTDELYPLISEKHRRGIERRLLTIYAVVEHCLDIYGEKILKS